MQIRQKLIPTRISKLSLHQQKESPTQTKQINEITQSSYIVYGPWFDTFWLETKHSKKTSTRSKEAYTA